MTFTNILRALGLINNGPLAEPPYNPKTRGTPAPAPNSKSYPGYAAPPNIVNGYPGDTNYASPNPAPAYNYYPTQPAPTNPAAMIPNNLTSFVPHDDSESLKPPHVCSVSSSVTAPSHPADSENSSSAYANPQLPNNGKGHRNIGENNGKRKKGTKKSGRPSGDSFKVHGNTINGAKGDKVGVFDFGNKYHRTHKKRGKEEDSAEEESDSSVDDDERD